MDAQKLGAFIASCRKEKNMTQADLAKKLQVTDKAVSRWERGIGFPDINTIESLADALDISVLELMKSEKSVKREFTNEEAAEVVTDALHLARMQQKKERRNAFKILAVTAITLIIILYFDTMQWQTDTIIFTIIGVVFPLLCLCGFIVLLGCGRWRKITGRSSGQTFVFAFVMLLILIIFLGLFFAAGITGIGPVPD